MNVARKKGKQKRKKAKVTPATKDKCLSESVSDALEKYFKDMDGHEPANLYDLIIAQVEKPLIESVIENSRGNISRAAQVLGLNRATLRNRMQKYGIDK
ncbi:MAG: Fis family transcriptional regulator [Gammaproteobacteria bacterium]|nr:Fis family transcriptional regulator [Gammaproteobacteria bacterium]